MIYTFDTEFLANGETIELISIGLVNYETKEQLYLVSKDFNFAKACQDKWIYEHVIKNLNSNESFSKEIIKEKILTFLNNDPNPKFYLYCGSYDWVVFAQIFGDMVNFPKQFPYWFFEIKQDLYRFGFKKDQLPKQTSIEHNALNDALHNVILMDLYFPKLSNELLVEGFVKNDPITKQEKPVVLRPKFDVFRHTRDA